jgi:hypothetical protein
MANTQIKEIFIALAVVAESFIKSFKDGKLDFQDIGNFFDDITPIQQAYEGALEATKEPATMTNDEKADILDAIASRLEDDVPANDLSDILGITDGVISIARIVARNNAKKNEGEEPDTLSVATDK